MPTRLSDEKDPRRLAERADEALDITNMLTKRKMASKLPLSPGGERLMKAIRFIDEDDAGGLAKSWDAKGSKGFQTGTPGGQRPLVAMPSSEAYDKRMVDALGPINTDNPDYQDYKEADRMGSFSEEYSHVSWEAIDDSIKGKIAERFEKKAQRDPNYKRWVHAKLYNNKDSGYVWSDDIKDYVENTKPRDFSLKKAMDQVEDKYAKEDLLDEIRAKTSEYVLKGSDRAKAGIMEAYPEFELENDKNQLLKNKVKQNGKRR